MLSSKSSLAFQKLELYVQKKKKTLNFYLFSQIRKEIMLCF